MLHLGKITIHYNDEGKKTDPPQGGRNKKQEWRSETDADLIFPILLLVGAAFAFSKTAVSYLYFGKQNGPRLLSQPPEKLYAMIALLAFSALISLGIIWACYGFRYSISSDATMALKGSCRSAIFSGRVELSHALNVRPSTGVGGACWTSVRAQAAMLSSSRDAGFPSLRSISVPRRWE